jgi:probable addiction module antidote protein
MPLHKSYQSYLIESLVDPAEAAAYLDAVLEDDDLEYFLVALKNVAEARRLVATTTHGADWESCYQLLTQGKTPGLLAIAALLRDLGLKLSVTAHRK